MGTCASVPAEATIANHKRPLVQPSAASTGATPGCGKQAAAGRRPLATVSTSSSISLADTDEGGDDQGAPRPRRCGQQQRGLMEGSSAARALDLIKRVRACASLRAPHAPCDACASPCEPPAPLRAPNAGRPAGRAAARVARHTRVTVNGPRGPRARAARFRRLEGPSADAPQRRCPLRAHAQVHDMQERLALASGGPLLGLPDAVDMIADQLGADLVA